MKKRILLAAVLMGMSLVAGCDGQKEKQREVTKVVLTAGFEKGEVFRIEKMSCSLTEMMILLTNMENQYEAIYGAEIWEKDFGGITLEKNIKETMLAQISQVKTMNLLAVQHGVSLSDEEKAKVKEAASAYFSSLNGTEIETLHVTMEVVENLYREYALADKVYQYIIKDINPEISDDEARNITVQHIQFKTYETDGAGQKIEYSDERKAEVLAGAKEVLQLARQEDSDFERLVLEYSDGEKGTISFGKGEMESAFEETGFNLETGEISDIIETSYGYHIIKCITTFNRKETDDNKVKIVEKRKEEVFGQEYEAFAEPLVKKLNDRLWEQVTLLHDEEIVTDNFFEVYKQYVGT